MKSTCPAVIVGGGAVGLVTALLLAQRGHAPYIVRKAQSPLPGRSVALMASTVDMLKRADVWKALAANCTPLNTIRIVDAMGRLLKAPTVNFHADETGLEAFAMNIENDILLRALEQCAHEAGVNFVEGTAETVGFCGDKAAVKGEGFEIETQAIVAADGRNSVMVQQGAFERSTKHYPQCAVTALLMHSVSHENVSTEFHTPHGPMTFVPAGPCCSAVVWVTTPDEAKRLQNLSDVEFSALLTQKSASFLGRLSASGKRGMWPLEMSVAAPLAQSRIYLAGEAAHTLPPIGAQGLNLGMRDAQSAAAIIADHLDKGGDPGAPQALQAYCASRKGDVKSTMRAVDALNRSLLLPYLPVHIGRGFGLFAAQKSRFVRNRLMTSGLGA